MGPARVHARPRERLPSRARAAHVFESDVARRLVLEAVGALSGYGLMASNGAADLLADYIAERPVPRYAPAFRRDRYDDPAYRAELERWGDSGQH